MQTNILIKNVYLSTELFKEWHSKTVCEECNNKASIAKTEAPTQNKVRGNKMNEDKLKFIQFDSEN